MSWQSVLWCCYNTTAGWKAYSPVCLVLNSLVEFYCERSCKEQSIVTNGCALFLICWLLRSHDGLYLGQIKLIVAGKLLCKPSRCIWQKHIFQKCLQRNHRTVVLEHHLVFFLHLFYYGHEDLWQVSNYQWRGHVCGLLLYCLL